MAGSSSSSAADSSLADQRLWPPAECAAVLERAIGSLKDQLAARPQGDHLVWDKDDEDGMDFVAACANLRAHCFGIRLNTKFTIKCETAAVAGGKGSFGVCKTERRLGFGRRARGLCELAEEPWLMDTRLHTRNCVFGDHSIFM